MRTRGALVLVVVAALALGAVTAWATREHGRRVHVEGAGPLSATSGTGGKALAPRGERWFAAFGSFMLCLDEPATAARIERVRHRVAVAPRELGVRLRTVTTDDVRRPGGKHPGPFDSASGRRPGFLEREYAGSFTDRVAGTVVTQTCAELDRDDSVRAGVPRDGFQELVVVMEVGRRGAHLPATWVDYTVDGEPYSLQIDWEVGGCGTRYDVCRRP